jgi:hypothetical protein
MYLRYHDIETNFNENPLIVSRVLKNDPKCRKIGPSVGPHNSLNVTFPTADLQENTQIHLHY